MSQSPSHSAASRPQQDASSEENQNLVSVVSWKGVLIGSAVTLGLGLALGALTAETLETNLGARASMMFAAMFVGAFVAGKIAGRMGVIQGVAMAVIFIVVGASLKAYAEIDLATKYGHQVLGPMDMGGLILGDLIHLVGGFTGGWLADTLSARAARSTDVPA
ncbi:MAG: hypothetical protein AB7P40_22750 [Chloroflexota bacterium]